MSGTDDNGVVHGSENIFADLGLANPEERELKARLATKIYGELEDRGWTQSEAAAALGLSQPDVSRLTRGMLRGFSVERLLELLVVLDYRVSIRIEGKDQAAESIQIAGRF